MPMDIQFECAVCAEIKSENHPHFIDEDPLCTSCTRDEIVPRFEDALKFEHFYPPKWGSTIIDVSNFKHVLEDDFIGRYNEREKEYKTKVSDRLYCSHHILSRTGDDTDVLNALDVVVTPGMTTDKCNTFLGSKQGTDYLVCPKCTGTVCTRCEIPLTDTESNHKCEPLVENESDAFDGLEKGVSFQLCPHCDRKVELKDACNEITCVCGGHLCFICGEAVPSKGPTEHFTSKGCPRWGPRASATASSFDIPGPTASIDQMLEAHAVAWQSRFISGTVRDPIEIVPIIIRRDEISLLALQFRMPMTAVDPDEDVAWRQDTALLLDSLTASLNLALTALGSAVDMFSVLMFRFQMNIQVMNRTYRQVPSDILLEHPQIEEHLTYVVDEAEALVRGMQQLPQPPHLAILFQHVDEDVAELRQAMQHAAEQNEL